MAASSITGQVTSSPSSSAVDASVARSEYTSLLAKDCKRTSRDEESGSVSFACPGIAPYRLTLHDSDARQSVDVIVGEGGPQPLDLWSVASSGFSELGEQAEWRFTAGASAPSALILRFNAHENPATPNAKTSWLVVAKLAAQGSCVIAKIAPGAAQNAEARERADASANARCLKRGGG